jgi:pimeloyl-ACP methyl ester carboxylesterase
MYRFSLVATLCLCFLTLPIAAQTAAEVEAEPQADQKEQWFGTLDVGAATLRLLLEVTSDADGKQEAVVFSVDQGNAKMPTDTFSIDGKQLKFTIDKVKADFAGQISSDGNAFTGKFTQFGVARDLTFKRSNGVPTRKLETAWVGDLQAGPQTLRVQVRQMKTSEGESMVLFDSLTQRATGMKAELEVAGESFVLKVPGAQATYKGTLNEDKTQVRGQWTQMGNSIDLELTRSATAEKAGPRNRPQSPQKPFSYESKSVTFASTAAEVMLGGTLTYPSAGGPFPCVVLVSGSGPQNRNEDIFGHKPFAVIADHFAKRGIATLRYDDRGIGESTGSFIKSTTADFAQDAAGAIEFAKKHEMVDAQRLGVIGHSEGGLIATMLAAERNDLAHVVLMAGPGVAGDEIIYDQTKAIAQAGDAQPDYLAEQESLMRELVAVAKTGDLKEDQVEEIMKKYPLVAGDADNSLMLTQLQQFATPWFRYFLNFDPAPVLVKASCPVLALLGEHDLQVTVSLNAPAIEAALAQSPHPDSKFVQLDGLNHLFQPCTTGSPSEYDMIEQTLDPSFLTAITDWVNQH